MTGRFFSQQIEGSGAAHVEFLPASWSVIAADGVQTFFSSLSCVWSPSSGRSDCVPAITATVKHCDAESEGEMAEAAARKHLNHFQWFGRDPPAFQGLLLRRECGQK